MTANLETHALKLWTSMLQMNRSQHPVSREYARSIVLPTLALATPFPKLAERINRELGTEIGKEISNDH